MAIADTGRVKRSLSPIGSPGALQTRNTPAPTRLAFEEDSSTGWNEIHPGTNRTFHFIAVPAGNIGEQFFKFKQAD
jgi:hypothetical protein